MEQTIRSFGGGISKLLLHSCCAPCSSAVLECLTPHFSVTVFYFNPNIFPDAEYLRRKDEQLRLIQTASYPNPVSVLDCDCDYQTFLASVCGLESCPEGGARCQNCFSLRLRETASAAKSRGFPLFGTTLTVSPHKDAAAINRIGEALAAEYDVRWLPGDFKKKNGYLRSAELSRIFGLYRQDYCGCEFSLRHP